MPTHESGDSATGARGTHLFIIKTDSQGRITLGADLVADIGEIQMLGSPDGGSTWVPAKVGADGLVHFSLDTSAACKLSKGGTPCEEVTCVAAGTDYPTTAAMPATARYVVVYCIAACIVAMGEATSPTKGVYVPAGVPTRFSVSPTGTAADDKPHVQSPTAGAVARFTYMGD